MGYITLAGSTITNKSLTVRGYSQDLVNTKLTGFDTLYHSPTYLTYFSGGSAYVNQCFQEQWQFQVISGGGPLTYLDTFPQNSIDNYEQGISAGPGTPALDTLVQYGPGITPSVLNVAGDNSWIEGLNLPIVGTAITLASSNPWLFRGGSDNILAPFGINTIGTANQYYFQMAIWDFPGSSIANMGSCNIQFADARGSTLIVPFNSPLITYPGTGTATLSNGQQYVSFTGGSGITIRIDGASVSSNIDLTQMTGIAFKLQGVGTSNFTFRTSNLKLIPSTYSNYSAGNQTRIGWLEQEAYPGIVQPNLPAVLLDNFIAKDYNYVVKFNAGHTNGTAINQFSTYLRVNPDRINHTNDYLKVQLQSSSANTVITAWDGGTAGTAQTQFMSATAAPLTTQQDYVLVITLNENNVQVSVDSINEYLYSSTLMTTTPVVTNAITSGYAGYDFLSYTGDFTIDYVYAKDIILAEYISKVFNSTLPVEAISLYAQSSPPNNLSTFGYFDAFGSAVVNFNLNGQQQITNLQPPPAQSDTPPNSVSSNIIVVNDLPTLQVTKNLSKGYIAGVTYDTLLTVNNLGAMKVTGSIRYDGILDSTTQEKNIQGGFRVVLWDKWFQKPIFLQEIINLSPDIWNTFETEITSNIYTNQTYLEIQHAGTALNLSGSANYYLNNVQISYRGIDWAASNDGGTSWTSFYNNINDPYKVVRFSALNNKLQIRARAYTTDSWISEYQAVPHYMRPNILLV